MFFIMAVSKERRTSSFIESKQQSLSMDLSAYHPYESDNTYEAGRAEACGALCRIFCAHKTKEHILPVYYTRFYLVMYYGLQTAEVVTVYSNIVLCSPHNSHAKSLTCTSMSDVPLLPRLQYFTCFQ